MNSAVDTTSNKLEIISPAF